MLRRSRVDRKLISSRGVPQNVPVSVASRACGMPMRSCLGKSSNGILVMSIGSPVWNRRAATRAGCKHSHSVCSIVCMVQLQKGHFLVLARPMSKSVSFEMPPPPTIGMLQRSVVPSSCACMRICMPPCPSPLIPRSMSSCRKPRDCAL